VQYLVKGVMDYEVLDTRRWSTALKSYLRGRNMTQRKRIGVKKTWENYKMMSEVTQHNLGVWRKHWNKKVEKILGGGELRSAEKTVPHLSRASSGEVY